MKIRLAVLCLTLLSAGLRADTIPVKPEANHHDQKTKKLFVVMSGAVYSAALMDMRRTMQWRDWYQQSRQPFYVSYEADPFARPLIKLPKPAYYATGLALATGVNFLAWKMEHSRRFHKVWFIPQLLSTGGNAYGYESTWYKH
jgi:hypothetical protein